MNVGESFTHLRLFVSDHPDACDVFRPIGARPSLSLDHLLEKHPQVFLFGGIVQTTDEDCLLRVRARCPGISLAQRRRGTL